MSVPGKRQQMWGLIAVVVLVAAAAAIFFRNRQKPAEMPGEFKVAGVCLACQQETTLDVPAGTRQPYVCPHCGERAVYAWLYCPKCQKRFIPALVAGAPGEPPHPPRAPVCPGCGNPDVAAYCPTDIPGEGAVAALPLPPWPYVPGPTSTAPAAPGAPATSTAPAP